MSPSFADIAAAHQYLPNPLSADHLAWLARVCEVDAGTRLLDLGCGGGELLNQWARNYELKGTGVDESSTLIQLAQTRANDLEVWSQVHFVVSDVLGYPQQFHQYNIVSCLNVGAWDVPLAELLGTLQPALKDNQTGLILLGQSYWQRVPPPDVLTALGVEAGALYDLADLVAAFDALGMNLVDMLILERGAWDSYYAQQWRAVQRWLKDNPAHQDAPRLAAELAAVRHSYLKYEREHVGWGVFVLEAMGCVVPEEAPQEKPLWLD